MSQINLKKGYFDRNQVWGEDVFKNTIDVSSDTWIYPAFVSVLKPIRVNVLGQYMINITGSFNIVQAQAGTRLYLVKIPYEFFGSLRPISAEVAQCVTKNADSKHTTVNVFCDPLDGYVISVEPSDYDLLVNDNIHINITTSCVVGS
jgi:hypothetical protein